MECIHGIEIGCTLCTAKPSRKAAYKVHDFAAQLAKMVAPAKPAGPRQDPDVALAQAVAAGALCPDCLTPRLARGCHCSRRAIYEQDTKRSYRALLTAIETAGLTPREAAGLATSVQRRAGRVAALTPDSYRCEGEQSQERLTVMETFHIEPTWFQPSVQEADHLPV